MKARLNFKILIVVLGCFVFGGSLFGAGYWLAQRSLQKQIKTWAAQVASRPPPSANLSSGPNAAHNLPSQTGASLPETASPERKEFMQNQATLTEKMTELRKQNSSTNGMLDPKVVARFQQENAGLLRRQKELSQIIAGQQAKNPVPAPPPLQIPSNASPQLKNYLTTHDQLMRDEVAFMSQHRTDAPATRQAAMQQWRQQNAGRFKQLQQESQALAQSASAPTAVPATITK